MKLSQDNLNEIYDSYSSWRGSHNVVNLAVEHEIFAREFARFSLPPAATILEVGFGEGRLLDWAQDRGFTVEGVEISSEYVDAARSRGHQVVHGTLHDLPHPTSRQYDAILCIDVLEHLALDEIVDFFRAAKPLLKENGVIFARFPNGGSPFGRFYQHGDATHRTALTGLLVDQLARLADLRVAGVFNAARALNNTRFLGITARLKFMIAVVIELLAGEIYYGIRIPLDPNMVVHLRHRDSVVPRQG